MSTLSYYQMRAKNKIARIDMQIEQIETRLKYMIFLRNIKQTIDDEIKTLQYLLKCKLRSREKEIRKTMAKTLSQYIDACCL